MAAVENVTIRTAVPADCPAIAAVQIQSYRTAYAPFFPESYLAGFSQAEQEQDWRDLLASLSEGLLFVAAVPGAAAVGYVLSRPNAADFPGYGAEIVALHVIPAWKGRGVGRALLGTAVAALAAQGHTAVFLWTLHGNPVRAWYERLGGLHLGEKRYDVGGREVVEVAYGWPDLAALLAALSQEEI